jgi:hypothetical protein
MTEHLRLRYPETDPARRETSAASSSTLRIAALTSWLDTRPAMSANDAYRSFELMVVQEVLAFLTGLGEPVALSDSAR